MFLRIENLSNKKLVGKSLEMSLIENKTFELWRSFMPHRLEIKHLINEKIRYSMQVYDKNFDFSTISPTTKFTKWAALEVSDFEEIPENMKTYKLEGGLYAVFQHKGTDFPKTMHYIFGIWLPNSEYKLDNREHFEVLGEKYQNNHPDSEEEVWIPIKKK